MGALSYPLVLMNIFGFALYVRSQQKMSSCSNHQYNVNIGEPEPIRESWMIYFLVILFEGPDLDWTGPYSLKFLFIR